MALPDYLKDTAKDYARQLTATTSAPIDTSKFTGRQFVAGEDPLQTAAINLATQVLVLSTIFSNKHKHSRVLEQGPGLDLLHHYMSPYQQGVIDETLRQFDLSRARWYATNW